MIGVDIVIRKSFKFILKIILIIFILQFIYMPTSKADSNSWGEIFDQGDDFLELGQENAKNDQIGSIDNKKLQRYNNKIV